MQNKRLFYYMTNLLVASRIPMGAWRNGSGKNPPDHVCPISAYLTETARSSY